MEFTLAADFSFPSWLERKLIDIAVKSVPYEMCGVITRSKEDGEFKFTELPNVHDDPKNFFSLHPARYKKIKDDESADVVAIVHSHPNGTSKPSVKDEQQLRTHKIPYIIVGTKDRHVRVVLPSGAPLIGREYSHGIQDCYTIVKDYYKRELSIDLPDFARDDRWWENASNASLYEENFKAAGFISVPKEDIKLHDVLICYWGDTALPNHALIYLGSNPTLKSEHHAPLIGARLYLHHLYDCKSCVSIMGDARYNSVILALRHKELLNDHVESGRST